MNQNSRLKKYAELFAAAMPECGAEDCEARVIRTEWKYESTEDGWLPVVNTICFRNHRIPIWPLEFNDDAY